MYPWFGSIYNGAGFGMGVGYLRQIPRAGRFNTTGAFTLNHWTSLDVELRAPGLGSSVRVQPTVDARWSRLRDLTFSGVGPDTTPDDRSVFGFRFWEVNAGVAVEAGPLLTLSGSYGYLGMSTSTAPGVALAPATGDAIDYQVTRAAAILDWRPSPGYSSAPTRDSRGEPVARPNP